MTLKNTDRDHNRIIFKRLGSAALVLLLLLTAWAVVAGTREQMTTNNEGASMKNFQAAAAKKMEIPALDAAAPAQFETAAFALG